MKITDTHVNLNNGKNLTVAIITSRFNAEITEALTKGCLKGLEDCGVKNIQTYQVPGALEIPFAASCLIKEKTVDAIIALGCIIKGETYHFEIVCDQSAQGLMALNQKGKTPIINGVLTAYTEAQAQERATTVDWQQNKGYEAALTAVEMTLLKQTIHSASKTLETV